MRNITTLNRNDLYKQVWSKPMSRLAPKYGLSGNGLKKICKKLNVPTPPRGHWAKVKHGIKVKKLKLPKLISGSPEKYTLQSISINFVGESAVSPFSPDAEVLINAESKKYRLVNVPEQLTSSLPIVRQTRKELRRQQPNDYGVVHSWGDEHLNIRVSPNQINRALRIMNALLKGLKKRGFLVSETKVEILGEKLKIILEEKVRRIDHTLTEREKRTKEQGKYFYAHKWDFIPTGILAIRIDEYWAHGKRKSWRDTPRQKLENLLDHFILGAIKVADSLKKERLEREEQHRICEEERRLRAETEFQRRMEQERRQGLENQAASWNKSQQLRNYIDAVEKIASIQPNFNEIKTQLQDWLFWARQHANRIDPLSHILPFLSIPEETDQGHTDLYGISDT